MTTKRISVTSHVKRDFLQNAAIFNSLPRVAWEYISNSLDNARDDVPLEVVVEMHSSNLMTISDNGTGMSRDDLQRFFQMHGENIKRKKGKRARGRFGTGKCAAFGIANELIVDTIQEGKRNVVKLSRSIIENAEDGKSFHPDEILVDVNTTEAAGTTIEIRDFIAKRLNLEQTIQYVERHLARWRGRPLVVINGHICKSKEIPVLEQYQIRAPKEVVNVIGDVSLLIKVSPTPLGKENNGIDIFSHGVWHETTLAEVSGDQSNKLFGEIDVPKLEEEEDEIPAFDLTRSNQLNRANPRVVVLLGWIAEELEAIRKKLVSAEEERRKTEEARKLQRQAKKIENILNDDFNQVMDEFELAQRISARKRARSNDFKDAEGVLIPGEGSEPTSLQETAYPHSNGRRGKEPPGDGPEPRSGGPDLRDGNQTGSRRGIGEEGRKKRRSMFSIRFDNLTVDEFRSRYDRTERIIYINLDHPQVASVLSIAGGSQDSKEFLAIVYEIAAVEYAQAIQFERLNQDQIIEPEDALFSVGETIDRVTRKFAAVLGK